MFGHREIFLHSYPPAAIRFGIQPFAGRRWSDPRGPNNRFAGDALPGHDNAVIVHFIDGVSQTDLHTQLLKVGLHGAGKLL